MGGKASEKAEGKITEQKRYEVRGLVVHVSVVGGVRIAVSVVRGSGGVYVGCAGIGESAWIDCVWI